jgi:hypothetical protein
VLILSLTAYAGERLVVPVDCSQEDAFAASCGDDLTIAEAKREYATAAGDGCARAVECGTRQLLYAATDGNACGEPTATGHLYTWAPISEVVDGTAALERLKTRLADGLPFNETYVVAESASGSDAETHIALCHVRTIKGISGPPAACATVAILRNDFSFIRAAKKLTSFDCPQAISITLGRSIKVDFNVQTALAIDSFVPPLARMLENGLGFSTIKRVAKGPDGSTLVTYFMATSPLRESKILKGGWREAIDFDLWISVERPGFIAVSAASKPMVNRLATGFTEYHGPNEGQVAQYARTFNQEIEAAILTACATFSKQDAQTIICN